MTAQSQNIVMWQGDTHVIRITVKDEAGAAVNLASATARWWMAKAATSTADSDILIKKSSDPVNGVSFDQSGDFYRVIVDLLPEDTEEITPGRYYHECEVVDAAGDVITVTVGAFTVKPALIPDDL